MKEGYQRPNPDQLLVQVQAEEKEQSRGKLKIFLGYVAGVGKTYAMLEAAHQRKEEGVDVVLAYVETHNRRETEKLVQGLEIIPRRMVDYHHTRLTEMNLDAVLARRPRLALVDELAHTNAPGSRHPKRYQDVEELLNAGIDVYTTINIQHLESLNDVIQQITGIIVHETIPDSFIDDAHEIELVDLPPEELLRRLQDGKVYIPDQAARAIEKFFRRGNLTALRELSMRRAAERVDSQMVNYMQTRAIPGPWPAGDRILVCLSTHPMGERLLRAGRRLAEELKAEWFVLFVETPDHLRTDEQNRLRIQKNFQLAEELGANVIRVSGTSVADEVIHFCHQNNITKIVAGKPLRPRWSEILHGGSVIDQIIRKSGHIDIYIVSEKSENIHETIPKGWLPHRPFIRYIGSIGLVALMTLIGYPIRPLLEPTNLVMLYLAAVVIAAVFLGRGPSILASLLGILAFDFFFINPKYNFTVNDTQYLITFIGLLIVGLVISTSASLLRDQVISLRRQQKQNQELNNLSRELTAAGSLEQVLNTVISHVSTLFGCETIIFLPDDGKIKLRASSTRINVDENEMAIAEWAFKNGQTAGRGTDTLPSGLIRYTPLVTARGKVGILGIKTNQPDEFLDIDQRIILEGFTNLAALAIERAVLAEQAAQSDMLRNTERLQSALLNSISHELRTPLASITGVLTSLSDSEKNDLRLDKITKMELIDSAVDESRQLNLLVENLLDMTRLQAGALHLKIEPADFQEVIGTVLNKLGERLRNHPCDVQIPENFPLVPMDQILIAQVLINLLDNACKYSLPGKSIIIVASFDREFAKISIQDQGFGIPPDDIEKIFDKFYRVQRTRQVSGTGLGLSICKGIITAHGGEIWAKNNPKYGATFTFSLPLQIIKTGTGNG
jgi:two-component system sensor histidine kinase KdpD